MRDGRQNISTMSLNSRSNEHTLSLVHTGAEETVPQTAKPQVLNTNTMILNV